MTLPSKLFSPLNLGPLALPNRIMISPMCQYSAVDGEPTAWHFAHLGSLAMSGAGLLCLEATAVVAEGRITPGCLGLWSSAHEAALQPLVQSLRAISKVPLALQLSHAGRKASSRSPWEGGTLIDPEDPAEGGWLPSAPSALPQKPGEAPPREMSAADIDEVITAFAQSAQRARRLGFDAIELHMAHGYLMHQFLSPLSNQRSDAFGGSLENRMRLPLAVFSAVREAAGPGIPVGVRLSATDWAEGGWDLAQTLVVSKRLEALGCDFLDISSGGISHQQKIPLGPGYQVPFAQAVKQAVGIPVVTVGLITEPQQAEDILAQGQADMVALARGFLFDPRWPWRAAAALGGTVVPPPQLLRSLPHGHAPIFGELRIGQR
jgi:2,4-dienoyl-CoA reductase-like NADH-dependent reductase (Old Yellow Enzyme family)